MKKVYLLGIGGIAMSNLACLLKAKGYKISGSDSGVFGPSKELLEKSEVNYFNSYSDTNIRKTKPDMIVVGNTIGRGNPELEYILENGIPYQSMPEAIREYVINSARGGSASGGKKPIVVAGTSGKTTTTAILAWILKSSGLKPTALTGGTMVNTGGGFLYGTGKYAVIEGDEYNSSFYDSCPKFLHYRPYHAIITNIQMDHLDIYGNMENVFKAFQKLVKLIPASGSLILNKNNSYTEKLSQESRSKVITFGEMANLEAKNIKYSENGISFDLINDGLNLGKIESPLLGHHNIENILSATAVSLNLGLSFKKIALALARFKGVKRRLEIIHRKNNVTIIDDFAHNPEKVSASISAIKKHFPKHRLISIFEPRTGSSRRKFFQDIYPDSFKLSDAVYIAEPFKKDSLKSEEVFSSEKLVEDLKGKNIEAYLLHNAEQIINHISKNLAEITSRPTIIVVMTSGEFDGLHQKLISLFK